MPRKPRISGRLVIRADKPYTYTFVGTDAEDHDLIYFIDWGDGGSLEEHGPFAAGEKVELSHSWELKESSFNIRAQTVDQYDGESEWATLPISTPTGHNIPFWLHILQWIFERFPILSLFLT